MRKVLFTALFLLAFCSCAFANMILYRGADNLGTVQTIEAGGSSCVSVEEVAELMGFAISRSGDELVLTRGRTNLRVLINSGAAWYNSMTIIPLQSAPFEKDGKIWLDTSSAANLFQRAVGSGALNRLRFNSASGNYANNIPNRYETESGTFDEPTPTRTQTRQNASVPQVSQPRTAQAQTQVQTQTQRPVTQARAVTPAPVKQEEPKETEFIEIPSVELPELENTGLFASVHENVSEPEKKSEPEKIVEPEKKSEPEKISQEPEKKSQPRYMSFKPTDNREKNNKKDFYSGEIKNLRWTAQEGRTKKIRVLVEVDEEADPQVFMSGGSLHALFAACADDAEGLLSPFENISAKTNDTEKGTELIFTPENFTKADKTVLTEPRRIAFDFFFPDDVEFIALTQQETEKNIILPEPKQEKIVLASEPEDNLPPALIIRPEEAAKPKGKTIVIDPGHGGKDPGTSANGVVEKDVNLSIGLMLGHVLATQGYNVIMTRNTDVYLKLQERTDIANNANADLFVSIHVNALPKSTSTMGFEISIMALPTDKDAMELAKIENREYIEGSGYDIENVDRRTEMLLKILGDMQQNNKISESTDFAASLYNAGVINNLPMKRVAQAPFFVLRGAAMPAVLLETGFVTNPEEAARLITPDYQAYIAGAMAIGITNYLK